MECPLYQILDKFSEIVFSCKSTEKEQEKIFWIKGSKIHTTLVLMSKCFQKYYNKYSIFRFTKI